MQRMIILLMLIFAFQNAKADTLDYWQVWVDDSLIGSFNVNDVAREVLLSDKLIRNASQLKVQYVSDHFPGTYHCFFMDDDYQFAESEIVKNGEIMSMSLKALAVSGPPVVPMFYDVYIEKVDDTNRTLINLFQVRWE